MQKCGFYQCVKEMEASIGFFHTSFRKGRNRYICRDAPPNHIYNCFWNAGPREGL